MTKSLSIGVFAIITCFLLSCKTNVQNDDTANEKTVESNTKIDTDIHKLTKEETAEPLTVTGKDESNQNSKEESERKARQVKQRLNEIKAALENHEWAKIISYSDPVLHAEQKDLGMSDEQYIFEMLNFAYKAKGDYQEVISKTMASIKTVTFDTSEIDTSGDYLTVTGLATLNDGETMTITMDLMLIDPPLITGANG